MDPEKPKNSKLKIAVDIFATLSVILYIVQFILASRYFPGMGSRNPDGSLSLFAILILVNALPWMFSVIWLFFRYGYIFDRIGRKYPFTKNVNFQIVAILGTVIIIRIFLRH